ncbi:MAG TPA: hypothetical protein VNY24_05150 [Candidatus Acidoferrales bacterium]|jgi:hypothetical protein|nr:hypothetical protein [Candidatus Acidoferrales bacterium]
MLILAKAALGLGATMAMAGAYVFHEGVIRVDVDEHREGGSHVHFWVPATVVAAGMHFMPKDQLNHTTAEVRPFIPALREVAKELEKYPNVELVDVSDAMDHVRVAMADGKLQIDAVSGDGDVVHVSVPARVLRDVADELEGRAPGV